MTSEMNINGMKIIADDDKIVIMGLKNNGQNEIQVLEDKIVDGNFNGNIIVKGNNVNIEVRGDVEGNIIHANQIKVEGDIEGNITHANQVHVKGNIEGNVVGGNIVK